MKLGAYECAWAVLERLSSSEVKDQGHELTAEACISTAVFFVTVQMFLV